MVNIDNIPDEKNAEQGFSVQEEKKEQHMSAALTSFKEIFENQENLEERLRIAIEFMKTSLSQEGTPRFKDFWEAKKMCLPLFKEKINPLLKAQMWNEYAELSSEAKRLKDLLEERSTFAIEQIELALKALEQELAGAQGYIEKASPVELSQELPFSKEKRKVYDAQQREVQFYITLTARLKDLRREVLTTEMRVRHKNRLLKRVSSLGDEFLPKKKALIKELSDQFVEDVKTFSETYFNKKEEQLKIAVPLHKLREEIKAFQDAAKKISLNSNAFSSTRIELSECWEIIKRVDKEKKKEFLDKKLLFKENYDKASLQLEDIAKDLKEKQPSTREEVYKPFKEWVSALENADLLHADVKTLKGKMRELQEEALKPFIEQEQAYLMKKQEQEVLRKQGLESFKHSLQEMLKNVLSHNLQTLMEMYTSFDEKKKSLKVSERESYKLDETKKELYEAILLKREQEISEEDLGSWQKLLKDWEMFREKARGNIEIHRKEMGSSGFDFEKAMLFRQQIDLEKARLDRASQKTVEIEDRLS
jgi:hypothetical protein